MAVIWHRALKTTAKNALIYGSCHVTFNGIQGGLTSALFIDLFLMGDAGILRQLSKTLDSSCEQKGSFLISTKGTQIPNVAMNVHFSF